MIRPHKMLCVHVHRGIIHKAKRWERPKCPPVGGFLSKCVSPLQQNTTEP